MRTGDVHVEGLQLTIESLSMHSGHATRARSKSHAAVPPLQCPATVLPPCIRHPCTMQDPTPAAQQRLLPAEPELTWPPPGCCGGFLFLARLGLA